MTVGGVWRETSTSCGAGARSPPLTKGDQVQACTVGRNYLGIELDPNYHAIASARLEAVT
ncbi:MAG: hypothetical protein M3Y81_03570 [Chloroflexota bacterium]|nr:hypothetical protein [Chloroflexota bacterium]